MKCAAIIVAAGSGSRLRSTGPKQLLSLGNTPLFLWSVRAFRRVARIAAIVLVVPRQKIPDFRSAAQEFPDIIWTEGGPRRQDSVQSGLQAVPPQTEVVLVHDAARPFLTSMLVELMIDGAVRYGAAIPVAPVTETVKRVEEGKVIETVERARLVRAQTPQAFRREILEKAFRLAPKEQTWTDDASMLEFAGFPVAAIEGDPNNIKITYPEDLRYAEFLLQEQSASGLSLA